MAALFGPRFALSVALFAALRGGLAGGVGFRECLADGRRYALFIMGAEWVDLDRRVVHEPLHLMMNFAAEVYKFHSFLQGVE